MTETKKSFCRFCHVFCGVEVDVEEGRVLAVRGDPDNAVSQGYTCRKGRAEVEGIYHPDRKMAAGQPELVAELRALRAEPVMDGGGYEPEEDFAFRMITYRMKGAYCTQGQNLPALRKKRSFNPVLMNLRAMQSLGVEDGDIVVVDSGFGSLEGIVEATEDLAPGVVALAHGWGDPSDDRDIREKGSNVQRLIPEDQRYDPVTGLALQSAVPVNVSPRSGVPPASHPNG